MPANLRGWEILIIAAIVVLLFGAKRLPDAARGLGRSLRIFKAETKGLGDTPETPSVERGAQASERPRDAHEEEPQSGRPEA